MESSRGEINDRGLTADISAWAIDDIRRLIIFCSVDFVQKIPFKKRSIDGGII